MSLPMVVSTFLSCRMCFEIGMEKANIEIIDKVDGERGVGEGKGSWGGKGKLRNSKVKLSWAVGGWVA